jgi:enamine deaminase RidA (YjgF/YER057c/UK114 family)
MERRSIHPVPWSLKLGFDQAVLIEGHQRQLVAADKMRWTPTVTPRHPGNMAAQLELSLDNLEAVLAAAGMSVADVVRLNVYTTDFDELVKHWTSLMDRFGNSGGRFAASPLGVARLFTPDLFVMLEATAVD